MSLVLLISPLVSLSSLSSQQQKGRSLIPSSCMKAGSLRVTSVERDGARQGVEEVLQLLFWRKKGKENVTKKEAGREREMYDCFCWERFVMHQAANPETPRDVYRLTKLCLCC